MPRPLGGVVYFLPYLSPFKFFVNNTFLQGIRQDFI